MQPTLCSKCKKNVAVVFISRMNEKGEPVNEGLCLKCAAQLGLPQVEDMMKRMGITPDDLENINSEMMQAFGGAEELGDVAQANEDGDEDEESGKTATFPFLNRLFGGNNNPPAEKGETPQRETGKESRKAEPGKEGLLGVEGVPDELILQGLQTALESSAADRKETAQTRPITYTDLYDWGVSGTANSAETRRRLLRRLGLPPRLSKKELLQVLNTLYTYDSLNAEIEKL